LSTFVSLGFIQEIRQTNDVNTLQNMTDDSFLFQVGYRCENL